MCADALIQQNSDESSPLDTKLRLKFLEGSYLTNFYKDMYRDKGCVIVKSCKWPFAFRLLKVQRGTASKKGIFYGWISIV